MDFPARHVWLPEGTIMTFVGMSRFCWNRSLLLKRHGVGLLEAANRSQGVVLFWCRNPQTDSCCDFPLTVVHSDYIYIEFNHADDIWSLIFHFFEGSPMNQWGAIWIVSLRWSFIPGGVHCSSILSPPATSVYCWLDFDWESIANSASRYPGSVWILIYSNTHTKTLPDFSENKVQYPQIQWSIIVFPCFPHQNFMILRDTLHFQTDLFPSSLQLQAWRDGFLYVRAYVNVTVPSHFFI